MNDDQTENHILIILNRIVSNLNSLDTQFSRSLLMKVTI